MKKEKWVYMPHAGHFICGSDCRFHLNTYVGKYIVSTVGEYWPDQQVRRIHAEVHDPAWYAKNMALRGDNFDRVYMEKFGYEDIGANRKYETMVFKAKRGDFKCCPWEMKSGEDIDFDSYNDAGDAYKGHLKMCDKWSKA
jgi:hypothetical protein